MPTARQTDGKLPGRSALLSMMNNPDITQFLTALLSSVVLKDDLKTPSPDQGSASPGTASLPSMRDVMFTRDGGLAVRVLADEALQRGEIVTAGSGGYVSCRKVRANDAEGNPPFGVVFESVSAGDVATIVIGGMARVQTASKAG